MNASCRVRRAVCLLGLSIALGACSGKLSAQAPRPQSQAPQGATPALAATAQPTTTQAAPTVQATEGGLRALPDFSPLVERYGPAVVNVEVVEKTQPATGGVPGLSPNDPFYDFFRRFGIPTPDQPRGNAPPVRGAGSGFI